MLLYLLLILLQININEKDIFLPVNSETESKIQLTDIGQFGILRSPRPDIPAHLHTGIDIKRPSNNYTDELIYPITKGLVISKRVDGPYAQLIIEHSLDNLRFWTLYEHIAGILVTVGDSLKPNIPIARFMNREELNSYGWQFDHFHFEILKNKPMDFNPSPKNPQRYFKSHTLTIYSHEDLEKHFYDPTLFFNKYVN